MVKLDLLEAYICVIENNSFNLAAKQLKKSSAAISQKITALEKQLKVELIKRSTRNLEVTPIGHAYYEQCKKIVKEIDKGNKLIQTQHIEPSGVLRVACPIISYIPKIAAFQNKYPDVQLIIDCNERIPDLVKDKIDIIVGMTLAPPDGYVRKSIGKVRYCLCGSKKYFKNHGTPKTPQDLIHHRYIAHSMRYNENQIHLDTGTVPMQPWIWLNNTQAMLKCAIDGIGLVKLHNFVVEQALESGDLTEIFSELQSEEPLYINYLYTQYLDPKIQLLIEFLANDVK